MNDNNTDWKCRHCGHESPSHYGTCRMCGEPEKVPTLYNKWTCMGCGALNNADYETCFRCNMTAIDSDALYDRVKQAREDPRPPIHAPISDLPPQQLAEQLAESKLLTPDARDSAITREVLARKQLRSGWWRRQVWAALGAFVRGVRDALIFIAYIGLIVGVVMLLAKLFRLN